MSDDTAARSRSGEETRDALTLPPARKRTFLGGLDWAIGIVAQRFTHRMNGMDDLDRLREWIESIPTPNAASVPNTGTALSVREMQAINARRSARWMAGSPGWTTLEIAGELAGEVGELANVCKKLRRSEMGVPGNKVSDEVLFQQARGEMADVMIVLMLTASKLGIDLQDAVCATFNAKSEQMGFPERLSSAPSRGSANAESGVRDGI